MKSVPNRKENGCLRVSAGSVSAVSVAVLIAAGVVALLFTGVQGCAPGKEAMEKEIGNIVTDFYKALDKRNYKDIKDFLDKSDFKNRLIDANNNGRMVQFCEPYSEVKVEIKSVEVEENKAKVKARLKKNENYFRQMIRLELVEGKWLVKTVEDMVPENAQQEQEPEGVQQEDPQ
jgi:hypothetical protein